jgi:hypothetical protein
MGTWRTLVYDFPDATAFATAAAAPTLNLTVVVTK